MSQYELEPLNNQYTEENLNDSPSTLFVTDSQGNILISNEFTALTVGMPLEELLKCNVQDLVTAGYYDRSITMEAIRKKERVCKTVTTNKGFSVLSTAIPILYKDGEIQLIVTTSNKLTKPDSSQLSDSMLIQQDIHKLPEQQDNDENCPEIVAESLAMKQIIKMKNNEMHFDSLKDFTAVVEGRYILQALSSCKGNATEAANKLGIQRSVIYRKLKKMNEAISKA